MLTRHIHRLTIIIPTNKCESLNAWCKANLNPDGGDWFTPTLSPDGKGEPTHAICGVALTDGEHKRLLAEIAKECKITKPPNWDTMTREQKKQWPESQKAATKAEGVLILGSDNNGVWASPEDAKSDMNLQATESLA